MEHLKGKTVTHFKKKGDIFSEDSQLTIKSYELDKISLVFETEETRP